MLKELYLPVSEHGLSSSSENKLKTLKLLDPNNHQLERRVLMYHGRAYIFTFSKYVHMLSNVITSYIYKSKKCLKQ